MAAWSRGEVSALGPDDLGADLAVADEVVDEGFELGVLPGRAEGGFGVGGEQADSDRAGVVGALGGIEAGELLGPTVGGEYSCLGGVFRAGNDEVVSQGELAGDAGGVGDREVACAVCDFDSLPPAGLDAGFGSQGGLEGGEFALTGKTKRHRLDGFAFESEQDESADSHGANEEEHHFGESGVVAHFDIRV